jgi:hypothetical protein
MPRGDKSSYTDKQKRQAAHIEERLGNAPPKGHRSGLILAISARPEPVEGRAKR